MPRAESISRDGEPSGSARIKEEVEEKSEEYSKGDGEINVTGGPAGLHKNKNPFSDEDMEIENAGSLVGSGKQSLKKTIQVVIPHGGSQQSQPRKSARVNESTHVGFSTASQGVTKLIPNNPTPLRATKVAKDRNQKLSLEEDLQDHKIKVGELRKENTKVRRENRNYVAQLSKSDARVAFLEKELSSEKKKMKQAREEYKKKIKSGPVNMCDDGQMCAQLSRLRENCKNWASQHANSDTMERSYTMAEKGSIMSLLKDRYGAISDDGEMKVFHGLINCSELLLNSALTHLIWFEILDRPFYFLEHASAAKAPAGAEETLQWLVDLGSCGGESAQKNTYCWLGTLLKTLGPISTLEHATSQEKTLRLKTKSMKDAALAKLITQLKKHCTFLLRDVSDEDAKKRDDRLRYIVRQAHEVSHKLWTQGYMIKCASGRELPGLFEEGDGCMHAHPTMLVDKGNTSKDGQDIFLVTKPLVRAYGNESGEFDMAIRIFDPATICMAPKADLEEAAQLWSEEQKKQGHAATDCHTAREGIYHVNQSMGGQASGKAVEIPGMMKTPPITDISESDKFLETTETLKSSEPEALPFLKAETQVQKETELNDRCICQKIQNSTTATHASALQDDAGDDTAHILVKVRKRRRVVVDFECVGSDDDGDHSTETRRSESPARKRHQRSLEESQGGQEENVNEVDPAKASKVIVDLTSDCDQEKEAQKFPRAVKTPKS